MIQNTLPLACGIQPLRIVEIVDVKRNDGLLQTCLHRSSAFRILNKFSGTAFEKILLLCQIIARILTKSDFSTGYNSFFPPGLEPNDIIISPALKLEKAEIH